MKLHTNTPDHIRRLQHEIMQAKTPHERAMMGVEMYEMATLALKNRILRENPGISQPEFMVQFFRQLNKGKFDEASSLKIEAAIRHAHGG